jgi:hypothetical protein
LACRRSTDLTAVRSGDGTFRYASRSSNIMARRAPECIVAAYHLRGLEIVRVSTVARAIRSRRNGRQGDRRDRQYRRFRYYRRCRRFRRSSKNCPAQAGLFAPHALFLFCLPSRKTRHNARLGMPRNAKGPVSDNGAFRTFLRWRGMLSDPTAFSIRHAFIWFQEISPITRAFSQVGEACHEMAVIRDRIWSWSASHRPHRGADREEVDEHGGLCSTENPAQRPKGEARARQIGRSRGERARGRDGTATCGAVNEALSYRVTETPLS